MESPLNSTNKEGNAVGQLEEMLAYGSSYIDTKMDGLKSSARESLVNFFTELLFIFFGIMTLLIAVSFLMYGIAMGIGKALGGELWLGFVITGGIIVLGKLIFSKYFLFQRRRRSVKTQVKQYEQEMKRQREKFGHDMSRHSKVSKPPFYSPEEFLIWKARVAKSAFLEIGTNLKQEMVKEISVKKLTQDYPFYSTGIAAAAGFAITSGMASQVFKDKASLKPTSEKAVIEEKSKGISSTRLAFVTMLVALTEDVLKESLIPVVKEHLSSLANLSKTKPKEPVSAHEKEIRQGQTKMDAEGGNQGKDPRCLLQNLEPNLQGIQNPQGI